MPGDCFPSGMKRWQLWGEIRNARSGNLRIGANQSVGEYLLPEITDAFQTQYPGIKVKLMIAYSDAVVSALKQHELDIALVASQPRDEDLRAQLLMRDRLVAVMSPRHPLALRDRSTSTNSAADPDHLDREIGAAKTGRGGF